MTKNETFRGPGCPWNENCPGEDGSIVIGHHPDGRERRVSIIPGAGHPWICYVKKAVKDRENGK